MRILPLLFLSLCAVTILSAQAPEQFPYQAVIRDANGELLRDQVISVRFQLHQTTIDGPVVYTETMNQTTSNIGVLNAQIGTGTPSMGTLSAVDWSMGPYFLEIAYDLNGGNDYQLMGTTQLLSVPFSLHAKTTEQAVVKTKTQRDQLTSPRTGQLLFCEDCGSAGELQVYNGSQWTNLLGGAVVE